MTLGRPIIEIFIESICYLHTHKGIKEKDLNRSRPSTDRNKISSTIVPVYDRYKKWAIKPSLKIVARVSFPASQWEASAGFS